MTAPATGKAAATRAGTGRARRPALRWQRVPALAIGSVVVLLLAGILAALYNERAYERQRQREAQVQARMLAASVAEALDFEDVATTRDNVNSLRANPEVIAAAVYGPDGAIVAGYRRGAAALPATAAAVARGVSGNSLALAVPVLQNGRPLGTVYMRTSVEPALQRLTRYGGIALLAIMGSVVVIVLTVTGTAMRRVNAELAASNRSLRAEAKERAAVEQALRQAQKMQAVGQLTGGIAHDFNNLLTPITGGLEFIAMTVDDPRLQRMANNALEAARRGAKLTGQLLAFSRTQRLLVTPVDVNGVIEGMLDLLRHSIGTTVRVALDLDPGAGRALCDANQIENAILNLAINARDAMEGGGTLIVATSRTTVSGPDAERGGDYLVVSVTDTGEGMPPEVVARAAEPFFTTKELGKGTGLGLAQVYGIAHQYGGSMHIESALGEGTTVRILLPVAPVERAAPSAAVAAGDDAPAPQPPGARVLVVDDDDEVRAFLAATLEALGYAVTAADGGAAGLDAVAAAAPDLLLLDFAMPGMNGAEVAEAARALAPGLPIVMITGYAETAAIEAALGAGAPVLRKPFGVDDLTRIIEANLRRDGAAPTRAAS